MIKHYLPVCMRHFLCRIRRDEGHREVKLVHQMNSYQVLRFLRFLRYGATLTTDTSLLKQQGDEVGRRWETKENYQ